MKPAFVLLLCAGAGYGPDMFETDMMAAIRRLRRKLTFWRVTAVIAIVAALAGALWKNSGGGFSDHIARVRITGLITGAQRQIDLLDSLARSKKVKAVIVRINSPGGTTVGSEAVYDALRRIAAKKPVVSVMDSVAASGGYIAALGTDSIFARGNTITGSIGVIFQWTELRGLMDKIGVKMRTIKSAPLKAEPNPFSELTPEVRKVTEELVRDSFDWFVGLVAKRRKMTREKALKLADGRVYTGRQAVKNGIIDALGDERAALKWLREKKGVAKNLKVMEHKPKPLASRLGLSFSIAHAAMNLIGLDGLLDAAQGAMTQGGKLDGLVCIWQPER